MVGEFPNWKTPHLMKEVSIGKYACELELLPGVYNYKFCIAGEWIRDPRNPWVDHTQGKENSSLIVGGSSPPLFFAPCRKCYVLKENGEFVVNAEVEAGAKEPGALVIYKGGEDILGYIDNSFRLMKANRVFLQFKGKIPQDSSCFCFEYYDGKWEFPAVETIYKPTDIENLTIYSIYLDRWFRFIHSAPDERSVSRQENSTENAFYGGDLKGVEESLDYIVDMGFNAIALTPIFFSETSHRYDAIAFDEIDQRIGGEEALKSLINACHIKGLRLILDAAFTHCNKDHPAFVDLLEKQEKSSYRDWFHVKTFPVNLDNPSSYGHYYKNSHLPFLNLEKGQVKQHVQGVAKKWIQMGIDGLRLDAIEEAPDKFWKGFCSCIKQINPDCILLAECVTDQSIRYYGEKGIDCATDYVTYNLILETLGLRKKSCQEFVDELQIHEHRSGPGMEDFKLHFLDNHDTNRFITRAVYYDRLRLALVCILLIPNPIWFYYGTEHAITSREIVSELENAWPDRLPMPPLDTETKTKELVKELLAIRQRLFEWNAGKARYITFDQDILVFERLFGDGKVLVIINNSNVEKDIRALIDGHKEVLLEVNGQLLKESCLSRNSALVVLFRK